MGPAVDYDTDAPGMIKVDGLKLLQLPSKKNNVRYTTVLPDGDSKLHNKVYKLDPFGKDVVIEKDVCIKHVGKRLCTALRNLFSDMSNKLVTLSVMEDGHVTQAAVKKLQKYYSRYIRNFDLAGAMPTSIIGGLNHGFFTDLDPN